MRAVIQRVSRAKVTVDGETTGEIGKGILILLGVGTDDGEAEARQLADKIVNLRIFDDEDGKMNLSLTDVRGELLVVSQFTLYADTRRGRRPSYISAATPDEAKRLYEYFVAEALKIVPKVGTGRFQAMMDVELVNDGPVTIILDTSQAKNEN
ncbi:MAG: D-tyrosyl-tRNA(Tyr) deacylase [Acidobacteria bacterium]|nr:MAG: D-tyrosyl-tRNA(Tyr) deacylase [Acidobacteriota bacterium]